MLIRITLIVAIIAGLAAGALNFLQVKEKITTTIAQRDQNAKERDDEKSQKVKAQKLAKDTQTTLDKTKEELTSTKDERDKAMAEAADQLKKATGLAENLKKTTGERDDAQNKLASWNALNIPIEQIKATLASLKTVTEERDAIAEEKKILMASNRKLKAKLDTILDPSENGPEMTQGLKGKIVAVDPKYDFVVLNIGESAGVLEDGQMLVNRNGKLIAKVKIKSVQKDRSIANVMPGWRVSDVLEGDQVLY
jgi:chromosome segregation ATPase